MKNELKLIVIFTNKPQIDSIINTEEISIDQQFICKSKDKRCIFMVPTLQYNYLMTVALNNDSTNNSNNKINC